MLNESDKGVIKERGKERKMKILKIENISKVYGKNEAKVEALNNVSFEVEEGEFIAIIGPSGSGKSTLLHTIAGLENPTDGKVYFYSTTNLILSVITAVSIWAP